MNSCRIWLLVLSLGLAPIASEAEQAIPVQLTVTQIGEQARLKVSVTNQSKNDLTLYKSELPWGNRYSMIVVAVSLGGNNEVVSIVGLIDDPGPGTTVIHSGETISGEIDLARRFPQQWPGVSDKPLLVFWSYQLATSDERKSLRLGGWLELKVPKQK